MKFLFKLIQANKTVSIANKNVKISKAKFVNDDDRLVYKRYYFLLITFMVLGVFLIMYVLSYILNKEEDL